ncbi:FeoA family protein [Rhodothermus profundi]|uniref:Ferrous iron transport protein A n=1 Tax=Rhodothermus profundi TaxID=633813 RepID=A0A1M6TNY6_9BACT|nr:FeoA domain-containing protein [Rhodothermus profundi]SHK58644.1 ferrous iron transport protein A [Rhodothermus profundi]
MTTLRDLRPGERGRVTGYASDRLPPRIFEMGLLPGTEVELIRIAPLGDPLDLKVRGFHLSIRKHEAELILIERL